jgi:small subunit ribosomal protein S16
MLGFGDGPRQYGKRRIYGTDLFDLLALECLPGAVDVFTTEGNSMVVIRLARGGAKKRPFFNIVVTDSRIRRDGRFIERVGFYNPVASGGEQPLRVAFDRVDYWSGQGAQLSPTVARLVAQAKAAA